MFSVHEFESGFAQLLPIQEVILDVGHNRQNKSSGRQARNHRESSPVKRGILGAEQLFADDSGTVCSHDVKCHCDGPFTGSLGIEGQPRSVDSIFTQRMSVRSEVSSRSIGSLTPGPGESDRTNEDAEFEI